MSNMNDLNPNEFLKWLRIKYGLGANFYDDDFAEAAYELLFEIQCANKYLPIIAEKDAMIQYLHDIDARDNSKFHFDYLWEEYESYLKKAFT